MAIKKIFTIAFAGGGSGGHLYPQVAVAREILSKAPGTSIFFVSTSGSIEEKLVPKDGYELVLIPSGKLKGQGFSRRLKTFFSLFRAIFVCLGLLLKKRPDLIFSAGGYAGAPFLVLGSLMGIRCEILEQNRMPGLANRWMAKFCAKVYVNFSASKELFPGKSVDVVGHPCRPEIETARWSEQDFSVRMSQNPFRVFVFGGSQGAVAINRFVTGASAFLAGLDIQILHQTGEADYERVVADYAKSGFRSVKVEKFVFDMTSAYASAHLVVCRAGASSLAELAAAGKAALLIPLDSKDKHQEFNAKEMEKNGASITRLQGELTAESLAALLKELYTDRQRLRELAEKIQMLHHPQAARQIAQSLLEKLEGSHVV